MRGTEFNSRWQMMIHLQVLQHICWIVQTKVVYIESDYRMSDQQWRCGWLTWDWESSRDRVVMASRNCWCAAMMWSRSSAFFTRHRSSSHEHSSTCSSTTCPHHTETSADKTVDCKGDCAVCTARTWSILRERNSSRAGQKTTIKKRKNQDRILEKSQIHGKFTAQFTFGLI